MKKLRVLTASFDTSIQAFRISSFRGAVAQKVGFEHDWFHNHYKEDTTKDNRFFYRYPLIQYKMDGSRPMLVCIDRGVDEAHHFFSNPDWNIRIGEENHELSIARLRVNQFNLQVWNQEFHYNVFKWQALNHKSYAAYQQLERLADQYEYLEKKLIAHILAFAKGIDWHVEQQIQVKITGLRRTKFVQFKSAYVLTFDLSFKTNVFLPEYIGLGKGVSKGFGVIRKHRTRVKNQHYTTHK